MALLSFCGFDTPSLPAQGEQRRSSYFNIPRGNPMNAMAASISAAVLGRTRKDWLQLLNHDVL
jgi:hypothetical protein